MSRKNTKGTGKPYTGIGLYELFEKASSIVKRYARRGKGTTCIDFYNDRLVKKEEKLLVRRYRYLYFRKPNCMDKMFEKSFVPLQLVKEKLANGLPYEVAMKAALKEHKKTLRKYKRTLRKQGKRLASWEAFYRDLRKMGNIYAVGNLTSVKQHKKEGRDDTP